MKSAAGRGPRPRAGLWRRCSTSAYSLILNQRLINKKWVGRPSKSEPLPSPSNLKLRTPTLSTLGEDSPPRPDSSGLGPRVGPPWHWHLRRSSLAVDASHGAEWQSVTVQVPSSNIQFPGPGLTPSESTLESLTPSESTLERRLVYYGLDPFGLECSLNREA